MTELFFSAHVKREGTYGVIILMQQEYVPMVSLLLSNQLPWQPSPSHFPTTSPP